MEHPQQKKPVRGSATSYATTLRCQHGSLQTPDQSCCITSHCDLANALLPNLRGMPGTCGILQRLPLEAANVLVAYTRVKFARADMGWVQPNLQTPDQSCCITSHCDLANALLPNLRGMPGTCGILQRLPLEAANVLVAYTRVKFARADMGWVQPNLQTPDQSCCITSHCDLANALLPNLRGMPGTCGILQRLPLEAANILVAYTRVKFARADMGWVQPNLQTPDQSCCITSHCDLANALLPNLRGMPGTCGILQRLPLEAANVLVAYTRVKFARADMGWVQPNLQTPDQSCCITSHCDLANALLPNLRGMPGTCGILQRLPLEAANVLVAYTRVKFARADMGWVQPNLQTPDQSCCITSHCDLANALLPNLRGMPGTFGILQRLPLEAANVLVAYTRVKFARADMGWVQPNLQTPDQSCCITSHCDLANALLPNLRGMPGTCGILQRLPLEAANVLVAYGWTKCTRKHACSKSIGIMSVCIKSISDMMESTMHVISQWMQEDVECAWWPIC